MKIKIMIEKEVETESVVQRLNEISTGAPEAVISVCGEAAQTINELSKQVQKMQEKLDEIKEENYICFGEFEAICEENNKCVISEACKKATVGGKKDRFAKKAFSVDNRLRSAVGIDLERPQEGTDYYLESMEDAIKKLEVRKNLSYYCFAGYEDCMNEARECDNCLFRDACIDRTGINQK